MSHHATAMPIYLREEAALTEIASAYVTLLPSAQNFGRSTEAQVTPQLQTAGSKVGSAFGAAIKYSAATVVTAAGALLGTALVKGFQRLEAIDQATAKLSGLGHSAKEVDKIMSNALASVKGTAFGLGDAATVAASTVAAGVKPGRDLTKVLKLVADSATIAGTDLGSMGAIFNKVAASNKIQGDVIAQLNDQGIPIIQLLGKELGVTTSRVTELASKGKIDFATFRGAMEAGLGGAAKKSGDTFSGALANVGASLSRIGAGLLGGVFPHLAPAFQGITTALAPLEGKATSVGDAIGRVLGPALEQVGPFVARVVAGLSSLDFSHLASGEGTLGKIGESFKKLGSAFASIDFGALFAGLGSGAADTVTVFAVAIGFLADHVDTLARILPALVVAYAAYKTAQAAANVLALAHVPLTAGQIVANLALARSNNALAAQMAAANGVESSGILLRARNVIATVASTVATTAANVASKAFAAAQWLVNAALSANPIGLVVVAIAALVGGLIYAYKHSEKFRAVVDAVFGFIGKYVPKVISTVVNFVKSHWKLLVAIIGGPIAIVAMLVVKHFGTIKRIVGAVADFVVSSAKKYGQFVQAVITKVGEVVKFFKEFPTKIKRFLANLPADLKKIGGQIITGLVNGIKGAAHYVTDAVNKIISAIPKKIRSLMHIGSPSKVTEELGGYIGDGLAKGIGGSADKVAQATEKLTKKVKEKVSKLRDQLASVRSDFASLVEPIASNFTQGLFDFDTAGAFTANLTTVKGTLTTLLGNFKKLIGEGLAPGFLYQLFQSGGPGLINSLAALPAAQAQEAGALFGQVTSLSEQLGTEVAGATGKGAALETQTVRLERKLDKLIHVTERVPAGVGAEVNGAAGAGHRRGKGGGHR